MTLLLGSTNVVYHSKRSSTDGTGQSKSWRALHPDSPKIPMRTSALRYAGGIPSFKESCSMAPFLRMHTLVKLKVTLAEKNSIRNLPIDGTNSDIPNPSSSSTINFPSTLTHELKALFCGMCAEAAIRTLKYRSSSTARHSISASSPPRTSRLAKRSRLAGPWTNRSMRS